jgi:transcriptional regulator with XRE-family HTH domain
MMREHVGARLREIRRHNGWSLRNVARWTGIDHATLSKIERGKRPATEDHIKRISKGLRISVERLLGLESDGRADDVA